MLPCALGSCRRVRGTEDYEGRRQRKSIVEYSIVIVIVIVVVMVIVIVIV